MRKNRKHVPVFFQVFENDSLKEYLEDMALDGWKLTGVGAVFLHFESCAPHRIRYCVEVMEKPSVYASNQTEKLKTYREFCRDAGWDYAGAVGYLHIFCTEDEEAPPVETDSGERYERICQACRNTNGLYLGIFIVVLNLYSCYVRGTLLCLNGWVVMFLTAVMVWNTGSFLRWRRRALDCLDRSGVLPCAGWRSVRKKNAAVVVLTLLAGLTPLLYTMARRSSPALAGVLFCLAGCAVLMSFVFAGLLYWIREKRSYSPAVNMVIYWGVGILVSAMVSVGFLALVFGAR